MAEQCEVDGQQPFEVKRRSLADRCAVLGEPGIGGHAAEAEQVIDEGPAVVHFARGAERREDVTGVDAVEMNARDTRGVDQPLADAEFFALVVFQGTQEQLRCFGCSSR